MAQEDNWDPYQEEACVDAFCDENWGEFKTWCMEKNFDARDQFTKFDYCQEMWASFENFADLWIEENLLDEREDHNQKQTK